MPLMPIQFQCPGCTEPIEVDAEWALKPVTCPYCRRTVTAPAESTLPDPTRMPVAQPLSGPPPGGLDASGQPMSVPMGEPYQAMSGPSVTTAAAGSSRNRVAIAGFVMGLIGVFLLFGASVIMAVHDDDIMALQGTGSEVSNPLEMNQRMLEHFGGTMPGWIYLMSFAFLGAIPLILAGLVCSAIGLRSRVRRGYAVAGVVVGCLPVLFCVLNIIVNLVVGL
jgi:hypothetical protein